MTIHNLEGNFDQLWKEPKLRQLHWMTTFQVVYTNLFDSIKLFSSTMTFDFVFSDLQVADPSVVSKGAETFSFRFYSNGWEKERSRDLLLSPAWVISISFSNTRW